MLNHGTVGDLYKKKWDFSFDTLSVAIVALFESNIYSTCYDSHECRKYC